MPAGSRPKPAPDARFTRLKEHEERLRLALEASRLAVWDWNTVTGRVKYAVFRDYHPRVTHLPVYPTYVETMATEWMETTHPDDVDVWQPVVSEVLQGSNDTFTIVYRRSRGAGADWEWVEVKGKVASRTTDGRPTRIVGTVGIATDRERQETERRQREADLAQAIRLSSIAEVASALGHELNQPLAAAMGDVQAAQRTLRQGASGRVRTLALLERSLGFMERAAEIVRQHRRAIRPPSAGRQRIDLFTSASHIIAMFEADARRTGIVLTVLPPRVPCIVHGNRTQIEQVIANLVRNGMDAVTALREGPRRVVVGIRRSKTRMQVRVTDTGPGVPAALRPSLFTPYYTTKPEGTGLGLPLSRSIAEAHQGRLVLESGRAGRTTFLLELPRAAAEPDR